MGFTLPQLGRGIKNIASKAVKTVFQTVPQKTANFASQSLPAQQIQVAKNRVSGFINPKAPSRVDQMALPGGVRPAPTFVPKPVEPMGPTASTSGTPAYSDVSFSSGMAPEPSFAPAAQSVQLAATPITDTEAISAEPKTQFDIQSLLQKNLDAQEKLFSEVTSYFTPSAEEQTARTNLANLQSEIDTETLNTNDLVSRLGIQPGVTTAVASAQQNEAVRQSQYKQSSLGIKYNNALATLNNLQASRTARLDAAKFLYTANKDNVTQTLDLYLKTSPQNLGIQKNDATGEVFAVTKNPVTGETSMTPIGNVGPGAKAIEFTKIGSYSDPITGESRDQYGFVDKSTGTITPVGSDNSSQVGSPVSGGQWLNSIGNITSYGSPYWKPGLDVDLAKGQSVTSPVQGTVIFAGKNGGFGNQVQIKMADGNTMWLSHLDQIGVKPGQMVQPGAFVGKGGNTGNVIPMGGGDGSHLDITIKKPNGQYMTAKDVEKYLQGSSVQTASTQTQNLDPNNIWLSAQTLEYKTADDRKFTLANVYRALSEGRYQDAQRLIEKKATQQLPVQQQENIETFKTVADLANKIIAYNADGKLEGVGPFGLGSLKGLFAKAGMGGEEGKSVRALIGNIKGTIARLRGGTSFTTNEERLLDTYTPSINDSGAVIVNKIQNLMDYIEIKKRNILESAGVILPESTDVEDLRSKYGY